MAEFRYRKVSLQSLRSAVERLREEFGKYPLAQARPFLDVQGRELVRRVQDQVGLRRELHLVVGRSGQTILDLPTQRFADTADYEDGSVARLDAHRETPGVRIDPQRSFGQPAIRSVRTEVLAEAFRAGTSREELADLYELQANQIDEALRYEMIVAAGAAA